MAEDLIQKVEEAPDALDLNSLLGMTEEDINAIASSDTVTKKEDPKEELVQVDEPHITISTNKLLNVLRVSAMVAAAGENSFEAKVVVFNVDDTKDNVSMLLSDNKRNIETSIEILNKENKFKAFLAFTTTTLARLIKVCGSTFTIIERASTSIKTGKNIDFSGNIIQASPINSLAKIEFNESYPSFRLSLTDARILFMLASMEDSEVIKISNDGKIFIGDNFKFKTESYQVSSCAYDAVAERMFDGEYAVIDSTHLRKLTELSVGLDISTGNVKLNYTPEGRVECEIVTKRENSKIILSGTTNTSLVPLEAPVEVPSTNLKGALSVFPAETTLNMRISTDGVSLQSSNVRVSVLGKGTGK